MTNGLSPSMKGAGVRKNTTNDLRPGSNGTQAERRGTPDAKAQGGTSSQVLGPPSGPAPTNQFGIVSNFAKERWPDARMQFDQVKAKSDGMGLVEMLKASRNSMYYTLPITHGVVKSRSTQGHVRAAVAQPSEFSIHNPRAAAAMDSELSFEQVSAAVEPSMQFSGAFGQFTVASHYKVQEAFKLAKSPSHPHRWKKWKAEVVRAVALVAPRHGGDNLI